MRIDWNLPVWNVSAFSVTPYYHSKDEQTLQQWGWSCSMSQEHSHWKGDLRRPSMSKHQCLHGIVRTRWKNFVSFSEVSCRVTTESFKLALNVSSLTWLGHAHWSIALMYAAVWGRQWLKDGSGWRRKGMKILPSGPSGVGRVKLTSCGPQDLRTLWLETLGDATRCRSHCCYWIINLSWAS